MEVTTKLAIADANTLLREGLKRLMHDVEDFFVLGEAATDIETMTLVEQTKPAVLLLDRNIPTLEAVPILLAIKEQNLPVKVLILSLLADESQILNCARAGARGYILKSTPFTVLAEAVREVSRGRIWVDRHTRFADAFALLAHKVSTTGDIGAELNPLDVLSTLSKRELQILNLIARGENNEDIAKKLVIRPSTVKTHASKVFSKLNVKNRTAAALLMMQVRSRTDEDYPPHFLRSA